MQLRRFHGRAVVIAAFGLGAAGLALAAPAHAQEAAEASQTGGRYRVLIPIPEHEKGVSDDFGKKLVDDLRKSIDQLPRYVSVSKDELKDSLKKYKLKEDELDCIKTRQLAVQMGAEIVMCASYQPAAGGAMKLTAQLIGAKTGYTFDVPAVTATSPDDAAQQVFTAFNNYVSQLFSSAMCQQYLGSQQWPNALENCNAALAINPRSETALMDKSRALLGMDSLDAAYATLQELIKVNPTNQDALRNAGVVAARLNKPQESRGYFRTYLELNPGDANVRLNLANDASKAGDPEGALSMVEDGFKADSANPNLLLFAGHWALAASQKLANDARAADKDPPARSDSLAMVALKYYQRLVAVQDTAADPTVVRNMMLIMLTHDQAAQAVALGGRYVAVHPKDAGLWSTYADALNANDQFSQALAALDSASANDPNHENKEGAKRGQWLAERGQLDAARVALREAVQSGSISADEAAQLVFGIGYNKYFRNNDYDRALDYFGATRDLASSAVTKGQANFWIGSIYFQRGRTLAQAATEAKTQAAAEKAAAQFRQAGTYFDQCAAFTARNPAVARNVQAMTDYIKQYVDAVRKAAR